MNSLLYPPKPGEPDILSMDWFSLVSSSPPVFHASCYIAATVIDVMRSSLFYSVTPEIRRHKAEAIYLINKALEKGEHKDIPESIILAVLMMIPEASESIGNGTASVQLEVDDSPFKAPGILKQWYHKVTPNPTASRVSISSRPDQFPSFRAQDIHAAGCKAIIRAKGGIEKLQERRVLVTVSFNGLIEASFNILKPPEIGFYALPEAWSRMRDPTVNIPQYQIRNEQGSGLSKLGLNQEALVVMMDMVKIMVLAENHLQGSLRNPDIFAMVTMRDYTHHRLLSLPRAANLIHECCQLSALLFAAAVLFPMHRSSGVPLRLVREIKQCVEQTSLAGLLGNGRFFIWVLMLAGVAADGLPERQWAEETLARLLQVKGVSRWSEVKEIVESFLWMEFACDGGGIKLWDHVAWAM